MCICYIYFRELRSFSICFAATSFEPSPTASAKATAIAQRPRVNAIVMMLFAIPICSSPIADARTIMITFTNCAALGELTLIALAAKFATMRPTNIVISQPSTELPKAINAASISEKIVSCIIFPASTRANIIITAKIIFEMISESVIESGRFIPTFSRSVLNPAFCKNSFTSLVTN
jgi:hypothetical protein